MLIHKIPFAFTQKANKVMEWVLKWEETCLKSGTVAGRPGHGLWVRKACSGLSASVSHLTGMGTCRLVNISKPSSSKGSETRMSLPTAQDGCAQSVTYLGKWHGALYARPAQGSANVFCKRPDSEYLRFGEHQLSTTWETYVDNM